MFYRSCVLALSSILFLSSLALSQQSQQSAREFPTVAQQYQHKLGSGRLLVSITQKREAAQRTSLHKGPLTAMVVVYLRDFPTTQQIHLFEQRGLKCFLATWTPPMANHPLGFFLAEIEIDKLNDVLALDAVKKLDTAEGTSIPMNNNAAKAINAPAAWSQGWTGKGVKIGVLDSGIHGDSADPDLPGVYEKKNYAQYPTITNDVANRITGHGTHVAGTILGRGSLSEMNTGNGGGSFKGIAPEASLVFFKIGIDSNASASDASILGALNDAVNVYRVQIINMSYGGWGAYHDGSEPLEQKVDWCYSKGTAVFMSAGNDASAGRHYSGTVTAQSETDFIQVNVRNADSSSTRPSFNLVWFDAIGTHNNLTLKYYDASKNEITNINRAPTTESPRGTESQFSSTKECAPNGASTYYVKVVNPSQENQFFHIYEDYTEWPNVVGSITFQSPDPMYTIGAPSLADHCMSVGAFVTRPYWTSALGQMRRYNQTTDQIANFSSRGPRVDGVNKPDIAAPGSAVISLRDKNVYKTTDHACVDNDGVPGGEANYYVMQGTSMASPTCAGAAAVVLSKYPTLPPQQLYDMLKSNAKKDVFTASATETTWGAGKLDLSFLSGIKPPQGGWVPVDQGLWPGQGIPALAVHRNGTVYACIGKPWAGDTSKIYRSSNNGGTWTMVKTQPTLTSLTLGYTGTIYTAERNQGAVHVSSNNGSTWTTVTGPPKDWTSVTMDSRDSLIAATYGQGIYLRNDKNIWEPYNDGLLPAAQSPFVLMGKNFVFALVVNNGVVRLYRRGWITPSPWTLSDAGIDTTKNVNAVAVMPDGTAFAIVFDRVYRSDDEGATWRQIAILNDYLQTIHAPTNSLVLVGTVGGGIYRSIDKGETWSSYSDGLTTLNMTTMASGGNPVMIYAGASRDQLYRRTIGTAPDTVKLVSPPDGSNAMSRPVMLQWLPSANATTFRMQVSTRPDFASVVSDVILNDVTTWSMGNLSVITQYYWRVRAENDASAGPWSKVWSFTTAPALPDAFVLISPANGAMGVPVNVSCNWSASLGAATYRLQIARDSLFNSLVLDQSNVTNTYFTALGLPHTTRLYWRAQGVNAGGAGPWTSVWSFTTALPPLPAAPELISPLNGATAVQVNAALLWKASSGASSYHVQVSIQPSFNSMIFERTNITDTSITTSGLTNGATYYWRVCAVNAGGEGPWSTSWSYTTNISPPAAPVLVSPHDTASKVTHPVRFSWNQSSGATSYSIAVSLDPLFMPPMVFGESGLTATEKYVNTLPEKTKLYWRVNATNSAGTSPWSPVWSFTTAVFPPIAPILRAPLNNATNVPTKVTLTWDPVSTADDYHLVIDTTNTFLLPVIDQQYIPGTSFPVAALKPFTKYYWRVHARNEGGLGPWSATWSFVTGPLTGLDPIGSARRVRLDQNYPNPFASTTTFRYSLHQCSYIVLEVFDLFGRKVATVANEFREAGEHEARWSPAHVPAGVYQAALRMDGSVYQRIAIIQK